MRETNRWHFDCVNGSAELRVSRPVVPRRPQVAKQRERGSKKVMVMVPDTHLADRSCDTNDIDLTCVLCACVVCDPTTTAPQQQEQKQCDERSYAVSHSFSSLSANQVTSHPVCKVHSYIVSVQHRFSAGQSRGANVSCTARLHGSCRAPRCGESRNASVCIWFQPSYISSVRCCCRIQVAA
jgi:hypothetical protein